MKKEKMTSVLVIHENTDQLAGLLEQRLPELNVYYAQTTAEILAALDKYQPQVVFAINSRTFDKHSLHNAAHYPSVKWFHVSGSGIEHVLPWETSATLSNGTGILARHLAETVLGAMLAMNNNIHLYKKQQANRLWQQHSFKPLSEQTLLIIGLGAIGEKVADNAKALGMKVMATRRQNKTYRHVDHLYTDKQLPEIIGQADFVSLHIPYTEENHNLFDQNLFAMMKKDACFINTARGGLVDEKALSEALTNNQLKAAFIDVFKQEPLPSSSELWAIDNLFISPHMADSIRGYEIKYFEFFVENITLWNEGKSIKNKIFN